VRNLLDNAQRYGGSGVEMHLRTAPATAAGAPDGAPRTATTEASRTALEIEVMDSGPGVPQAELQRIFEPFYRSQHASERDGGVGLGLSLVQSIAHSHGGSARCYNRPGGGARFVVNITGA
jgi:two-component system, OmpR family, sensor kinase